MILEVDDLSVEYRTRTGPVRAVDGVSFTLGEGQALGLVGESGCGKSTTAKAVLRLLGNDADVVSGSVRFDHADVLALSDARLRALRWDQIALVPQTSMNSLDPVYRVGDQIRHAARLHSRLSGAELEVRLREVCAMVGLDPARLRDYPHQFSGGMRQRLVLALALVLRPRLLVADEPTTALDVITQHGILEQIKSAQTELGLAVVLVSHDIGVIWRACDRVAVMYAGRIVEQGPTREVLTTPCHPYTIGLMQSSATVRSRRPLISIPGHPPRLTARATGCSFATRCPFAKEICRVSAPPVMRTPGGADVACHFAEDAEQMRIIGADPATWVGEAA